MSGSSLSLTFDCSHHGSSYMCNLRVIFVANTGNQSLIVRTKVSVQGYHYSLFLFLLFSLFPFLSSPSVFVSLFVLVTLFPSPSLSHSRYLTPYRVCSGRLKLTCCPVHQHICCSDQLSFPLKAGPNTLRLWTEKKKKKTIPSRERKTTPKPKNTKIRRPL